MKRKISTTAALGLFSAACIVAAVLFVHRNGNELASGTTIDRIVVEKAERKLSIFHGGKKLKTYRVALGRCPIGAKEQEGDMKTPEGVYTVDELKPDSDYHLALHISYPSAEDVARAADRGVDAGFDIEIHGLPNGGGELGKAHPLEDWTAGCIAVTGQRNRRTLSGDLCGNGR